eukprot:184175-Pyramimonas_sp.AAC.1
MVLADNRCTRPSDAELADPRAASLRGTSPVPSIVRSAPRPCGARAEPAPTPSLVVFLIRGSRASLFR